MTACSQWHACCCFYPFVFVSLLVWDVAAAPVKPMHDEQGTEDSSRSGLWVWETEGTLVLSAPFRSKITHTHCWNMMKCRKIEMLDDYKQSSCQTNMNELSVIEMSTHMTRLIIIRSLHSCWQSKKRVICWCNPRLQDFDRISKHPHFSINIMSVLIPSLPWTHWTHVLSSRWLNCCWAATWSQHCWRGSRAATARAALPPPLCIWQPETDTKTLSSNLNSIIR